MSNHGSVSPRILRIMRPQVVLVVSVFILLLSYLLMVSSATRKSATVDEQAHLFRGVSYLETGATQFLLGHPLLGGVLSALPLLTEDDLLLPLDSDAWQSGNWSVAADQFLWQINKSPLRLIFLGRIPVIWLTLLLGAFLFHWGKMWSGSLPALLVLFLFALDPNILANGRLITGDVPITLFFVMTAYFYWRWSRIEVDKLSKLRPLGQKANLYLLLAGVSLGLAVATKYNAILAMLILGIWGLVLSWKRRGLAPLLVVFIIFLVSWVVIWLVYAFNLWQGFLPGGAFWDDLLWQFQYTDQAHGQYLFGKFSTQGWWYYFPVAFVIKTPIPTLLLLTWAIWRVIFHGSLNSRMFLLLPPVLYGLGSIVWALNIGYRYLLPGLPFLFLMIGVSLSESQLFIKYRIRLVAGLALLYLSLAFWIWPDYISYFNLMAAGDGWRALSDSNVDWGQDLPALSALQKDNDAPLWLSYFGTSHPSAYGIEFYPLPTWAPGPEQADPNRQIYDPLDPAPGIYAISVTNLHGAVLGQDRDIYARFRDMEPISKAGGSIFLYEIRPNGQTVDVVFAGLVPADLDPKLRDMLGTNDIRARWIEPATSFVWPAEGGWLAIGNEYLDELEKLGKFRPSVPAGNTGEQSLFRLPPFPGLDLVEASSSFGENLKLLGYNEQKLSGPIMLVTHWEVKNPADRPLQIFVHALNADGEIVGQWDGVDVDLSTSRAGDVFSQWHTLPTPPGADVDMILIGVYDTSNLERLGQPVTVLINKD